MVEATSYLHPLATRAGQRAVGATFIERAQRDAYRFVVTPKGEGSEDANWFAT